MIRRPIWLVVLILVLVVGGISCGEDVTEPEDSWQDESIPEDYSPPAPETPDEGITVSFTGASYASVVEKPTGWFETGQDADIVLNWFGFNESGGPLSFNHPAGMASDGERLLLADTWNNRVLIWNSLPVGNESPDVVLGQENFDTSESGIGSDKLNWPIGVATDGERVVVADTYNYRVLIWNEFPTENGQPADLVLGAADFTSRGDGAPWSPPYEDWERDYIVWPWAVWTDGQRLVVTSTATSSVLIWNSFPTENDQPADVILTGELGFGTPRTIASDGNCLVIGDYNPAQGNGHNLFWEEFPTADNEPFDFSLDNPADPLSGIMWGPFITPNGEFMALGSSRLLIWNTLPEGEADEPDLMLDYCLEWGDGGAVVLGGEKMYVSMPNGHRVVAFNSIPTRVDQLPDFSVGTSDIDTNPLLEENYFVSNPAVVSDGEHLFVASDFHKMLCVWQSLPDQDNAKPDIVYSFDFEPWAITLYDGTLAIGGGKTICIWNEAPLNGELPDLVLGPKIGGTELQSVRGVALDGEYFYVSDEDAGKIYVWQGIPDDSRGPDYVLEVEPHIRRLSSDGEHLAVTCNECQAIYIFSVEGIPANEAPIILQNMVGLYFNLPEGVFVDGEHLFVADTVNNRVLIWNEIPREFNEPPDIVLGEDDFEDVYPDQSINRLFWPGTVFFDGSYLWVGEFKFSGRIMRFSVLD